MAVAPKAKKSPAQVRAGQAYAAAGRASQAATRAKAIQKTGKPPPRSKAQKAATVKFQKAGQAALAAKKAGKAPAKKVAAVMPPELISLPGTAWPSACNEYAPVCASVAIACHLQAATGFTMLDEDVLKLHQLAGGESGATIENVLAAMTEHWPSLSRGRARLLSYFRTDEQFIVAGLVVGITLGHAGHAVLSAPGGMISWGQFMPWDGEPDEAWALEWGL